MSREEINRNGEGIKKQLSRFIDFGSEKALMLNNATGCATSTTSSSCGTSPPFQRQQDAGRRELQSADGERSQFHRV